MRLDHLLSKEEKSKGWIAVWLLRVRCEDMRCKTKHQSIRVQDKNNEKINKEISGGDALRGNTRTHPEHDG